MFVLYCPGKLLLGGIGAVDPPAQAPSAAPGALNALENANLNTCRKIRRGQAGGSFARWFSLLFEGAHPLLQVKFRGIWHELGARGKVISRDIPYPKTLPRQRRPPRCSLGCHCRRRGLGKSVRVPTRKGFSGFGVIWKHRWSLFFQIPWNCPQTTPRRSGHFPSPLTRAVLCLCQDKYLML